LLIEIAGADPGKFTSDAELLSPKRRRKSLRPSFPPGTIPNKVGFHYNATMVRDSIRRIEHRRLR
jgi:hypothetical protein